jgi:tellurite resistance protein
VHGQGSAPLPADPHHVAGQWLSAHRLKRGKKALASFAVALQEAGVKIQTAYRELERKEDEASVWMQRFIYREVEQRTRTRGAAYWDEQFPGLSAEARAHARMRRMLTRATVAGVASAAGASTAEVLSIAGEGVSALGAVPLGLLSVGAEMVYTTAIEIDLAFDLASIYGCPFDHDDVGEISTLLALAAGVDLVEEPTRHDKPVAPGETKPWRVMRQMLRKDFAQQVSRGVVRQAVLRNAVPVVGVLVSAAWNQIVLRRFANQVHTAVRQRLAITQACRDMHLGEMHTGRIILDGAWLIATADGNVGHHESLVLAQLIDSLPVPQRIDATEASFSDDEEEWFGRIDSLDDASRTVLLDVLGLVASADGTLNTPERRFLRRVARALGREVDLVQLERSMDRLRRGEPRPPASESAGGADADGATPAGAQLVPA